MKFFSRYEELKSHIFDVVKTTNIDLFTNLKYEIGIYIRAKYKYRSNIEYIIENLAMSVIDFLVKIMILPLLSTSLTIDKKSAFNEATLKFEL